MSWFTRSFSMSERKEEERGSDEDDEEEEEEEENDPLNLVAIASATGTSVKEDLSKLTKTFTRQFWGVASFLAPPSSPTREEKSSSQDGGQIYQEEVRNLGDLVDVESQSGQGSKEENLGQAESKFSSLEGTSAYNPQYESDAQGTVSSQNDVEENAMSSPNRASSGRPRLTGLRSDFAELRGTVATGFSRISSSVIRVVAGEDDSEGEEEGELLAVASQESAHPPTLAQVLGGDQQLNSSSRGFDSFLKPLFGNILTSRKGDMYPEDVGSVRDVNVGSPRGEGESKSREMELLPSAIASGIGGISKFASSLLQIVGEEEDEDREDEVEDEDDAVGVTEAVVTFARNIAMHPETWLDFPMTEDETDDDFELTIPQKEHARAMEKAAPGLGALKTELCPNYITEERFWKIYFVLMHSRLSSNEAQILSTWQIVKARASMLQGLQKREPQTQELDLRQDPDLISEKVKFDTFEVPQQDSEGETFGITSSSPLEHSASIVSTLPRPFQETKQKAEVCQADQSTSSREETEAFEAKSEPAKARFAMSDPEDETEVDEWLHEEPSTRQHVVVSEHGPLDMSNMDEDVSFSDLEDDDSKITIRSNETVTDLNATSSGSTAPGSATTTLFLPDPASSPSRQGDGTPSRGEFNDWLTVEQDDVASAGSSP